MPIEEHPSFERPPVTTRLWRNTDIPKFIELIISRTLWLANAEVLATDDPYEGLPGAIQFPHRMWRTIQDVPKPLRDQIVNMRSRKVEDSDEIAFRGWFMGEEQSCIMSQSGRRDFYINCWHAANHESAAMWKIYGAPGAGIAVITNGARLETALSENEHRLSLGSVRYVDPDTFEIGTPNVYDSIMRKRASYSYESEVRLVHWHTGEFHDALENFSWNEETMRFNDIIPDTRPLNAGIALTCAIDVLVERVIVSPFAPPWYVGMVERLRDRLGYTFPVHKSDLLSAPPIIP